MDRLHSMQVFVAVADCDGFAPAARKLNLSPATVTRAVAALEKRLGVMLFQRTTRQVRLTQAGLRYLEDCRRILADLTEAEDGVSGTYRTPRGKIAVAAPLSFGAMYLAPLLIDFLAGHPQVNAEALFIDRMVGLPNEGLDVAVRIGAPADATLTAIPVGLARPVICGAPAYFERKGVPANPVELAEHDVVHFAPELGQPEWQFKDENGCFGIKLAGCLTVNTAEVAIAAAVAGKGLTQVLSYMITAELDSGCLKTVLTEFDPPPLPIHIVYREGGKAARIRAFVDFATARLGADSALN